MNVLLSKGCEVDLSLFSQQKLCAEGIAKQLSTVEAQLALFVPQHLGVAERLKRIDIVARSAGRVVNLDVLTICGLIRQGTVMLVIVPADQGLIVEPRVQTGDVDKLHTGKST